MTPAAFAARAHAVPYTHKGIWYSEIYLFLARCIAHKVTLIIESGVKFGMSTRLLAATCDNCPIIAIDRMFQIEPPPGVKFIAGEVQDVLPDLLARKHRYKIGLLIDGPKGATAIALKDGAFQLYPNVAVVGIHDVDASCGAQWHSHEEEYRREIGRALDGPVVEPYASKYPNGPGLGVWERRAA